MTTANSFVERTLRSADIHINGDRPWDLQLHDSRLLCDILARGSLALGEGYMNKAWDCEQLDVFMEKLLHYRLQNQITPSQFAWHCVKARVFNMQTKNRAWTVGRHHYDRGNDLFRAMLDSRMVYTCGYWQKANNLEQAQEHKLELVCRKLQLKPGMRILDVGCGWGSFMKYAAEHYQVSCVGITVSKEQVELGQELCRGLPIEFRLQDYRNLNEQFDAIASLGMFEHVGQRNYRTFMQRIAKCLTPGGLFLLHTIGRNIDTHGADPWISRYIFPNGELPCLAHIDLASRDILCVEDIHNFGADYDPTLMAWYRNFEQHWPQLKEHYDEQFFRMWRYYLLTCAGVFRTRDLQVWQWLFSHHGIRNGYRRPEL
jgi:cyclopropane-fatty-acyl-phospholipid synthase